MRFVVVALFVSLSGGCLEVDSPDGALACSTVPRRACPEGFYCLAPSMRCWRDGHFPADMADPASWNFGPPPDDMSVVVADDLGSFADMTPNDDLLQSD